MYLDFYGFSENPFSLSPNPRFIFFSKTHKEAFALLLYGINNRFGFIELSGEVGTGKTTVLRTLLSQLDEEKYRTALIFNPSTTAVDLMRAINHEFGIPCRSDNVAELLGELNLFLLDENAAGRIVVLIIDEAQNLPPALLEQVRLISNLETDTDKLIQIVLAGQPELANLLARPELRQINQRIALRYNLHSLDREDAGAYVRHRIATAGGGDKVAFSMGAFAWLFRYSRGTPRLINILCDRALLIAYTEDRRKITARTMALAFRDVMLRPALGSLPRLRKGPALAVVAALAAAIGLAYLTQLVSSRPEKPAAALAVKPAAAPAAKPAAAPVKGPDVVEAKPPLPQVVKPSPEPVALTSAPVVKPAAQPAPVAAEAKPAAPLPAKPSHPSEKITAAVVPMPKTLSSHVMRPASLPASVGKADELPAIHIEDRKPVEDVAEIPAGQPTPPDFKRALASELSLRSEAKNAVQAFNALAPFWQAPPVSQMNERSPLINQVKGQAEKRKLELAPFKGRLDDLLRLDSPALLTISPKGTKGNYLVALTRLRNGKLHIQPPLLGRNDFSKAEMASLWTGRAYIPWHNGEKIPANLAKGATGPDVIRLQVLLQTAGVRSVQVTGSYDENTVKGVREFQASRRIGASGKINPFTLIQLYKAVNGASVPSLTKAGKGDGV